MINRIMTTNYWRSFFFLFRSMEFSLKFDTFKSVWSIIYIERVVSSYNLQDNIVRRILSKLANNADPDEMPHYHLGLHC